MRIILYFFVLGLFISCNSKSFRAVQAVDKAYNLDSVAAEKRAKQISPCIVLDQDTTPPEIITTNTKDTVIRTVKDTIKLKCKDGSFVDTIITKKYYDINHRITKTNTRYITKTIEDKGKDIIIRENLRQLYKQKEKKDFWMGAAIICILLLIFTWVGKLILKSLQLR